MSEAPYRPSRELHTCVNSCSDNNYQVSHRWGIGLLVHIVVWVFDHFHSGVPRLVHVNHVNHSLHLRLVERGKDTNARAALDDRTHDLKPTAALRGLGMDRQDQARLRQRVLSKVLHASLELEPRAEL